MRRSAHRALRDIEEGTSDDAYWRQRTWKRVAVISAGPAANILVAFIIFVIVYLIITFKLITADTFPFP